jgi:hypothetical protein
MLVFQFEFQRFFQPLQTLLNQSSKQLIILRGDHACLFEEKPQLPLSTPLGIILSRFGRSRFVSAANSYQLACVLGCITMHVMCVISVLWEKGCGDLRSPCWLRN